MYKKYLIVASKKDKAGSNITTQLSQFRKNLFMFSLNSDKTYFDFYLAEDDIIYDESLDLEKIKQYDFVIFASKHNSEKKEKTLSVHAPGNWKGSVFGGRAGKVCRSSALFQKQLFQKLKENVERYEIKDYDVTLECTHHGPYIEKPCVFIEIGSTETEWSDRRAAFVVAKTISDTIESFKKNPYNEVAIGVGGPHYCPTFTKFQLESNLAFSHIIPQYAAPITEEMIKESWQKTEEDPDFVVLDWKGLGTSEERQKVIDILEKNHLPWKKSKDIKN